MAAGSIRSPISSSSSLLLSFNSILLFLLALSVTAASAAFDVGPIRLGDDGGIAPGRKVGGRAEVRGVQTDSEVQDLGLFCVEEHNRRLRRRDGGGGGGGATSAGLLTFGRVVAAQRQVVSGIKYYLRIAAFADGGERRSFDAVVVVKPWLPSRTLISFGPAVDRY
ncbi:Cysteine proteinase inhibitor 4 [Ananas comosus]|uniref:Cysteine proteinase inhibitor 4 n=1 Tax=Ananas comosus TaxID=4615 RepID=A0A199US65_ANACO|nr:Cysteine proteinase inhibitor 4 [Ananas comosus]